MRENREKIIGWTLVHEGGYISHPKDPGGATNKGITQAVYDAWRKRHGMALQSVRNIHDDEVLEIYRIQYWDRVQGDSLPSGVDYAVYDFAVNSGVSRSSRYLQRILGVKQDGDIGQITLAALAERDPEQIVRLLCRDRMAFLKSLRHWSTFGRGWTRRVEGDRAGYQSSDVGVLDRAVLLAQGATAETVPQAKTDVQAIPAKGDGAQKITATISAALRDNPALATVAASGGGTALTALSQPPLAYFVGVAMVLLVAGGVFWLIRRRDA